MNIRIFIKHTKRKRMITGIKRKPPGAVESASAYLWVDEEGIMVIIFKQGISHIDEHATENVRIAYELIQDIPRPLLIDMTPISNLSRNSREIYAQTGESGKVAAVALITRSLASRMVANFFLGFNKPIVPTRIFNDTDKARSWLHKQK